MLESGADALIVDLEDFTPPGRRGEARKLLKRYVQESRKRGRLAAIRINALEAEGMIDLAAAMETRPDVIAYPMTERAAQMHALHAAMAHLEGTFGIVENSTEILPVCETALGVAEMRTIVHGSPHIRCALLGAEDLANDLWAERSADGAARKSSARPQRWWRPDSVSGLQAPDSFWGSTCRLSRDHRFGMEIAPPTSTS